MKKYIKVLSILVVLFLLTACSNEKVGLNKKQFSEKISNLGFIVSDNTSYMEDDTVRISISAHNGKYQVEYYIFKDEERAKEAYLSNKKYFEGNNKKGKEEKEGNYTKYVQELSDTYNTLTRVDNTLLYASINVEYKKDLKKVLKELNY